MENKRGEMNKLAFIMSNILIFLGIVMLAGSLTIQAVMNKAIYMKYAAINHTGPVPSNWFLNLAGIYVIAAICIVVGLVLSIAFYKKGSK